MAIILVD